ncbi:MAG: neurofilament protein [Erysipelotrichaceae bacterium]
MSKKKGQAIMNKAYETKKVVEPQPKAKLKEEPIALAPSKPVSKEIVKKDEGKAVKKAAPKKAVEKVETKPVKKEVKKPAEKIEAKEVKKIATKKLAEKIETKEVKKIATKKPAEKIEAKEVKKIATKKAAEKIETKEVKKIATKKAAAKIETKEVKKIATKKPATKIASKEVKKIEAKKAAPKPKKANKKDLIHDEFLLLSLDECFDKLNTVSIPLNYQECYDLLLVSEDLNQAAKQIVAEVKSEIEEAMAVEMLYETFKKVCETMEIKAVEYKDIRKGILSNMKRSIQKDFESNSKTYLDSFALMEKVLMIGQRRSIGNAHSISDILDVDLESFVDFFMKLASEVLPEYQYKDVTYYEDFMFAVLSQYSDLYPVFEQRLLLDVADMYIKHNDFLHGDDCYNYILRENQIKDYIYYRFAHVYEAIDLGKAKAIAQGALQIIDERYDFYIKLIEIINK